MTPEVMASVVLAMDGGRDLGGTIDSESFADVGLGANGGRADVMNARGCKWKPADKGAGSRLAGIAQIHQRLAVRADGKPGLIVFSTCKNLIRTLPVMVYSRTNVEDIHGSCEDHAVDALRYGLFRRKPPVARRVPVRF